MSVPAIPQYNRVESMEYIQQVRRLARLDQIQRDIFEFSEQFPRFLRFEGIRRVLKMTDLLLIYYVPLQRQLMREYNLSQQQVQERVEAMRQDRGEFQGLNI